jgi:hypothetical protein
MVYVEYCSSFVDTWHAQLAINLGFLGTASIITGHLLTAYPAYPYLGLDGAAALSLFTHHAWIGVLITLGLVYSSRLDWWFLHRGQRVSPRP